MRESFGARFDVPPGYLNTASIGIPPDFVADAVAEAVARWRTGAALPPEFDAMVATARAAWARLVGVDTATVAIGGSVSQLAGLVAASIPDGTRVVTVAGEFTSTTFPFAAQEKRGVTVREVAAPHEAVDADLVVMSLVQSADGAIADLEALRRNGTRVFLDVTQAVGWLPVRLDWADWVVGGSYKWLLSPRGAAWLAVRPELLDRIVPHQANWYSAPDIWEGVYGLPLRLADDARRLDLSPAWFCHVGAAAALPWLAGLDAKAVRDHCVALADATLGGLGHEPRGSAIVSLDLTPDQRERLTAAGVVSANRAGRTRLSFHLYNTADDVDRVVSAVV